MERRAVLVLGLLACGSFESTPIEPDAGADATTDATDAAPTLDASADRGAPSSNKLVFVTKTGLRSGAGNAFVTAADALCKSEAAASGLGARNFVAWVSSSSQDAIGKILINGPWAVPAGGASERIVFANREALFTANLASPLDRHADGLSAPPSYAWTGTSAKGTAAATCVGWSAVSDQNYGTVGQPGATSAEWTALPSVMACDASRPVMCFEL